MVNHLNPTHHGDFLSNPLNARLKSTSVHQHSVRVHVLTLLQAEDGTNASSNSDDKVTREPQSRPSPVSLRATEDDTSFLEGIQATLKTSLRIAQESRAQGYDFRQLLANVLAGEYDAEPIRKQINQDIQQSPCVMFVWERSPSCAKALQAFEQMGIEKQVRVVRLDDPWDKGNPVRAEIGKRVGRSSVPMIFIGGNYVGGFDGGVSDEAPGIQNMAFKGTLRPALEAAGVKLPYFSY
jgi:glutaredoxin-related protein